MARLRDDVQAGRFAKSPDGKDRTSIRQHNRRRCARAPVVQPNQPLIQFVKVRAHHARAFDGGHIGNDVVFRIVVQGTPLEVLGYRNLEKRPDIPSSPQRRDDRDAGESSRILRPIPQHIQPTRSGYQTQHRHDLKHQSAVQYFALQHAERRPKSVPQQNRRQEPHERLTVAKGKAHAGQCREQPDQQNHAQQRVRRPQKRHGHPPHFPKVTLHDRDLQRPQTLKVVRPPTEPRKQFPQHEGHPPTDRHPQQADEFTNFKAADKHHGNNRQHNRLIVQPRIRRQPAPKQHTTDQQSIGHPLALFAPGQYH